MVRKQKDITKLSEPELLKLLLIIRRKNSNGKVCRISKANEISIKKMMKKPLKDNLCGDAETVINSYIGFLRENRTSS